MSFLIWKLGYSSFIAEIHSKLGTSSFHFSILSFHLVLESPVSLFKKLVLISAYWPALLRPCCRRIILGSSRVKPLPKLFCISKGTAVWRYKITFFLKIVLPYFTYYSKWSKFHGDEAFLNSVDITRAKWSNSTTLLSSMQNLSINQNSIVYYIYNTRDPRFISCHFRAELEPVLSDFWRNVVNALFHIL